LEIYAVLFLLVVLGLALTVGWVLMMVDAARTERWGWFVVMLVFGLAAVPYLLIEYGRTSRPVATRR